MNFWKCSKSNSGGAKHKISSTYLFQKNGLFPLYWGTSSFSTYSENKLAKTHERGFSIPMPNII